MSSSRPYLRLFAIATVCAALLHLPTSAGAAPTTPLTSITPGLNPAAQHVDGSTLWVRPGTAGSFNVQVNVSADPHDIVDWVRFPAIGLGWTTLSPLEQLTPPFSASYAFDTTTIDPGSISTVEVHGATSSVRSVGLLVAQDGVAPIGSVLNAQSAATRDSAAPVGFTLGSDAQSGIASWQIERRSSPITAGACASWGPWGRIAANPVGSISDPLPGEQCFQYRLLVTDHVGNVEVVDQQGELRTDRTAPVVTIDSIDTESVMQRASVELTGIASDASTGVRAVSVLIEDRYSICTNAPVDASGRWSCTWNIDYAEATGPVKLRISVIDNAGNRSAAERLATILEPPSPFGPRERDIDRTPPVVGLARMPLVSWSDHVRVKPTARDDRPGFIDIRMEQQTGTYKRSGFGQWFPALHEAAEVTLDTRGETTCFRAIAVDLMGNQSTSFPRCTTMPLDDQDMQSKGGWRELDAYRAWQGSVQRTSRRGASIQIRMSDPTPQLVVATCTGCGTIRVYHGTRVIGTYSLHAKRTTYRKVINLRTLKNPLGAPLRVVNVSTRPVMIDGLIARQ